MTEQVRIPAHMHTVRLCALTEQRSAEEAAAREAALQRQMNEQRAHMDRERAKFEAWLGGEAKKLDDLERAYTQAGYVTAQHRDDALDASSVFGRWCEERGIDSAALPPVQMPSPERTGEMRPEDIGQALSAPPEAGESQAITLKDVMRGGEVLKPTPCFDDPPRHDLCNGDRCGCGHHAAEARALTEERDRIADLKAERGGDGAKAPFHRGDPDGDERG